ncbi:MAG TPA: hypothetical protein VMU50_06190 [Polyangia bacterium]|nr:hypothetical protein [Polyangia bacterium]
MKRLLGVAFFLSVVANGYLGMRLIKERDRIEAATHAEMLKNLALHDLSYFLRQSAIAKVQLVDLAGKRPGEAGRDRQPPVVTENRFIWYPLEVTFTEAGTIDRVMVAGDVY